MARDLGRTLKGRILTDASAALGIIQRRGIGKVRHLDTQYLWIQDARSSRALKFEKVRGSENPADILTKNVEAWRLDKYLAMLSLEPRGGRAESAPELCA